MVHILFERLGEAVSHLVAFTVVTNLDRAISRQQFATGVRLKAQHGLKQQWMVYGRNAFSRRGTTGGSAAWILDGETEQRDAVAHVLKPFGSALDVQFNAGQNTLGYRRKLGLAQFLGEVPVKALGFLLTCRRSLRDANCAIRQRDLCGICRLVVDNSGTVAEHRDVYVCRWLGLRWPWRSIVLLPKIKRKNVRHLSDLTSLQRGVLNLALVRSVKVRPR